MAAKKSELLKCKTKDEVLAFAKANSLPVRKAGNKVTVGGWVCVFNGNRFQYIE
ncbi:hypothetical protein SEA_MOAB_4 [Streptomyces phage Moab]|nr:hypothetical protein SEA_MOAB_4 [Streptomyces phage Moab]WMI33641.1 hypothetical protein SEA_PATELGO_5 [Streptomyces phage Patelgo]